MIRLAVCGADGRMGSRICELARRDDRFELVAEFDQASTAAGASAAAAPIDAIIDFSSSEGAAFAAQTAATSGAALLVGTTALSQETLQITADSARRVPVMIAPNTSLGVAVLDHLVVEAARLLGNRFDVELVEIHHNQKRDAPSGTALRLAESLRRAGVTMGDERMHALRCGDIVGEHKIFFCGPGERIELSHAATTRDVFVHGALEAVSWLVQQKPGRYTINEFLGLPASP